ncbi:unnamed protein product [Prunus armeniaca]|uniref:Uncharacterized protein n=1 Tax=Prunus armeniaca TaxID=36596 RepID=A0A6J5UJT9_PRUAR|nr:unnamed protein product [Prunus armeniaca]CAB4307133.1 unnamed protein product [Prunus armeniaca]
MAPVPVPMEKLNLHYFPGSKIPDWLALEVVGKVADGLKLFPGLTYLEIVKCPKLICIPCDENGVKK